MTRAAMPRRCGSSPLTRGTQNPHPHSFALNGSSPLTRGTLEIGRTAHDESRFIPTHAGNTRGRRGSSGGAAVHPHSRGEHCLLDDEVEGANRFIPTHAGNTHAVMSFGVTVDGSSPLTRGTRWSARRRCRRHRFIPTHAGNTFQRDCGARWPPVHPHSRGEHWNAAGRANAFRGSSPLTRGTRLNESAVLLGNRFIPTHAGNTEGSCSVNAVGSVHPHSRGEHSPSCICGSAATGSSPLTRGTRCCSQATMGHRRFIPTHAGNTGCRSRMPARPSVHPHSRGEHVFA